jgi:histidinol-phosphatase
VKYQREIEFARCVAIAAGENAKRIRAAAGFTSETKHDLSPVTIADRDNERLICEAIGREFPNDGILGEEGSRKPGSSGRRWIIDPIDGTRDLVRGNRVWCVLIALEEADESLVGVAHFPMLAETYWAVCGAGAFLNSERLRPSAVDSFEACTFSINSYKFPPNRPPLDRVVRLLERAWSVRGFGGALDACMVAAGQVDVWFEPKVEPWDVASLKLILEEAGAAFFALDGSRAIDRGSAIGCAPGMKQLVQEALGIALSANP